MEGLPTNLPNLEEPFSFCFLIKATKIPRGPTTDVSKVSFVFTIHMDSAFSNVESICVFTTIFVVICSATSYPIALTSRRNSPPLDIFKVCFTKLMNQDKKVAFIRVYEDGALARYSEFMKTCHNMTIIVRNKGRYTSSLNGKSKIPNKILGNTTRDLIVNNK